MGSRTPLFEKHVAANARIVDFGGWDMPIHYGSQLDEHHHVRKNVGMFDVSHMTVIDITGTGARDFLDHLLANDIRRLTLKGKALYSGMLNEDGHVIDDLIVYWNDPDFLMVVNCATREKDLAWINQQVAGFDCQITERPELAIVALQGPHALDIFKQSYPDAAALVTGLKVYQGGYFGNWFVARTGYTGEKGLEIIIPAGEVEALWQTLADAGVPAIGLGARDTLRLEAGMNLYGSDMDETVSPYAANMGSTVVLDDRQFVGSDALRAQPEGGPELIGLVMTDRGVLRAHYPVFSGDKQVGEITSGAFSPTLQHSIALARVSDKTGPLTVEIRKKRCPVSVVSTPFVRHGKQVYKAL